MPISLSMSVSFFLAWEQEDRSLPELPHLPQLGLGHLARPVLNGGPKKRQEGGKERGKEGR